MLNGDNLCTKKGNNACMFYKRNEEIMCISVKLYKYNAYKSMSKQLDTDVFIHAFNTF